MAARRGEKAQVVILKDEEGNDVTPISLLVVGKPKHRDGDLSASVSASGGELSSTTSSGIKETANDILNHLEHIQNGIIDNSNAKGSAASVVNSSAMMTGMNMGSQINTSMSETSASEGENLSVSIGSQEHLDNGQLGAQIDMQVINGNSGENMEAKKADIDFSKLQRLNLSETNMIWLFDQTSSCVFADSTEEVAEVKAANARYKEVFYVNEAESDS